MACLRIAGRQWRQILCISSTTSLQPSLGCIPPQPCTYTLNSATRRPHDVPTHFSRLFSKKAGSKTALASPEEFSLKKPEELMLKAIEHLKNELTGVRPGRASPGMLDHLTVAAYGEKMPLKALGTVSVRDAQLLAVTVFDPESAESVAKAIMDSPLQLNPSVEGSEVLVPIPKPTQEGLQGLVRIVAKEAEKCKVSLRHARKVGIEEAQAFSSADERKRAEKDVQKLTDKFVAQVDKIKEAKEKEIMQG